MASLFFKDMKRLGLSSCSSPASTSVVRPPTGRALDRHTPHLRDPQRRVSITTPSKPPTKPKSKTKDYAKHTKKSSTRSDKRPVTLISPASSSRFLLNSSRLQPDDVHVEAAPPPFIDIFPDAIPAVSVPEEPPVQKPESSGSSSEIVARRDDEAVILRSCSTRTQDQVVVLRVSLHCKGCAGKVKKHISKMEGVTSFDIDIATKKVTVIGDVTPLGVLNSISKVKSAQFWPSPPAPPRASASF